MYLDSPQYLYYRQVICPFVILSSSMADISSILDTLKRISKLDSWAEEYFETKALKYRREEFARGGGNMVNSASTVHLWFQRERKKG